MNTEVKSSTGTLETVIQPSRDSASNQGPNSPNRVLPGERPQRKNYLVPALEIPGFLFLLNQYDRVAYPNTVYNSGIQSSKQFLLHGPWVFDQDPFNINQLGHPYQGSMMYGFARTSGLNFWESLLYSNAGSFMWKISGETDNPSINDQITTGNAGSLLGEELYRMACMVLEGGGSDIGFWRKIGAAVISPPLALNRLMFGNKYAPTLERRDPATFTRLRLGQSQAATVNDNLAGTNEIIRHEATADFEMDYGLPGKDGYLYLRPLDYFSFQITGVDNSHHPLENIMTRGLLIGNKYELGEVYRGIWGLYGSYDYISPQLFQISSTAGSLGTTAQWSISKNLILQGTALAGVGFAGGGSTPANVGDRNYHYGTTPQGLLALRLIVGERLMFDTTARQYVITGLGAPEAGTEDISRLNASCTVRIYGHHALGLQYVFSRRAGYYPGQLVRRQSAGVVSIAYNLIGDPHFGAVDYGN